MTALHAPLVPAWHDQALCTQTDPEIWFPHRDEFIPEVRNTCAACPVKRECLADALATDDVHYGIRAGLTPRQRKALRIKPCKWCGDPLGQEPDPRQVFHPGCLAERRRIRKRKEDHSYKFRKKTAA